MRPKSMGTITPVAARAAADTYTAETRITETRAAETRTRGTPPVEAARAARTCVIAVLQRILEVLDGRRPCEHLSPVITEEVFDQIVLALRKREDAVARAPVRGPTVRLRRIHLQMVSPRAANYFGTVERGLRTRAVAGRVEVRRVRSPGRGVVERWTMTEFGVM
ncbi:Rv3235 family protein [Gordonia liuliyuniae]|uniref:Rv3235 family protein n=1 Tax=Gordonia liuliyuniae TaxID=2911517 RepID=A0ABS9IND6_9ACTN|nr:Rv3235 family protein [Gordonia liuliyuniae]MCF8587064.1 Rv3235 family protein [Gordonia liuliyuniae]